MSVEHSITTLLKDLSILDVPFPIPIRMISSRFQAKPPAPLAVSIGPTSLFFSVMKKLHSVLK